MRLLHQHPFSSRLNIEKHQLDNGLDVLLLRDASAPVVAVQTWYRVGSRHEVPGKTGLAHLFEHLMFNQTANLAAGEFDKLMETAGGETNAATWVDWTYYRDNLPASKLELALRLESDRMQNLTLTDTQVETEREVVANERRFRVDDDVEGFLAEELFALAFERHPYRWPTIGSMSDIQGFTTADCQQFYKTFYAPNNATLILVGDVEPKSALALVERYYGAIPASKLPPSPTVVEPPQRGERRAHYEKPCAADKLIVAYKSPAETHEDWLVLQFVHDILVGGPSSRLHRRLVVEEERATGVQAMLSPFVDPGLFEMYVSMKRGHEAAEAEGAIDQEIDRLRRERVTDAELAKARNRIETSFWSELETADGKAEAIGHYETTLGDFRKLFGLTARLPHIGADDVLRVANQYFQKDERSVVIATPSGEDPEGGDDDDDGDDSGNGAEVRA
jgi:zinc protease